MRPRHDPAPKVPAGYETARRAAERALHDHVWAKLSHLRRRGDDSDGGEPCPVEPNRPLNLSGGAAAALEFDD